MEAKSNTVVEETNAAAAERDRIAQRDYDVDGFYVGRLETPCSINC